MKTEPSATATAGAAFATQPALYVEDSFGNIITTNTSTVVAALATGSGPLQGTLSISATAGVATSLTSPTIRPKASPLNLATAL